MTKTIVLYGSEGEQVVKLVIELSIVDITCEDENALRHYRTLPRIKVNRNMRQSL